MIEKSIYFFLSAWLLGLVALILGRFVGKPRASFSDKPGQNILIYLQVWAFTALAKLTFGYLGYLAHWSESTQSGFAEFFLPIATGAYFARQLLLHRIQK